MKFFKTWIKDYVGLDSPIGDLAGDIQRDKKFPSRANTYEQLYGYFESYPDYVVEPFLEAWAKYQMYLRKAKREEE